MKLDISIQELAIDAINSISKASAAIYKVNIIRKALNLGQNMEFIKGTIWYPYNPFITKDSSYYNDELRSGKMRNVNKFMYNGDTYYLLGGEAYNGSSAGLSSFDSYNGMGYVYANGFLGCAQKKIAQHMSLYFAKEIFEARYADYIEFAWLD